MYKSKDLVIDLENGKYKRYFRFIGIPFNEGWKTLPKVLQVAVTRISVAQTLTSPMPNVNQSSFIGKDVKYFVFLMISRTKKIEVFRSEDHNSAIEKAGKIAEYLNVKLMDYSQGK